MNENTFFKNFQNFKQIKKRKSLNRIGVTIIQTCVTISKK